MAINKKLSRRQLLGGTAAVVGVAAIPAITNATVAAATPTGKLASKNQPAALPWNASTGAGWIPIDALAAARESYDIYKGKNGGASGGAGFQQLNQTG
jgi:hypothetical protein